MDGSPISHAELLFLFISLFSAGLMDFFTNALLA